MKNKEKIINSCIVLVMLAFLVFLFSSGTTMPTNKNTTDNEYVTVTLINVDENVGNLVLSVKEGETYTDQSSTTIQVTPGTKLKAWFPQGMNQDYEVYAWGINTNGFMTFIKENTEDEGYYTAEKYVKTVNEDITIYLYSADKNADYNVVSFYDSSLTEKRTPIGLALVKDGETASTKGVIEQKKVGFDMTGWSKNITDVTEDLEVYPTYATSVWSMFRDYKPMFAKGLIVTLELSVISVALAMFLGIVICLIRISEIKFLSPLVSTYVEIIRGIPLLLQLLIVYTIIGPTRISFGSFLTTEVLSCIITLTINSSAYSSEIFRSGIQAVDKGQMEAARALGLSKWKTYRHIIIPQGIRNSLPSIVNELVAMIKETSLAVSVDASIGELMCVRKNITAATFINLPPYIIVAIIYFCVTYSMSKLVGVIEKRLAARD